MVNGFAAAQHHIRFGLGRNNLRIKPMAGTTFLLVVTTLVVCNLAARVAMGREAFDPRPGPTHIGS